MDLLDRLNEGRTYARASAHPSGLEFAARYNPPASFGAGYDDAYLVDEDLLVGAQVADVRADFADVEPGLGRVIFIYHLSGKRIVEFDTFGKIEFDFPSLSIIYAREGISKHSTLLKGTAESLVSIGARPENLHRHSCVPPPQMLDDVARNINNAQPVAWLQLPLSTEMRFAAQSILSPDVGARYLQFYLRSKAQELLALTFDTLERSREALTDTSAEENRTFSHAVRFVENNLHRQVSLAELAHEVGSSRSEISRLFLENLGATVQDYALRSRMTKAYGLVATDMALKQIAYEVGYGHTSNFSIAFKKTFGLTPNQARSSNLRRKTSRL